MPPDSEETGSDLPVTLAPPREVLEIGDRLERAGYETWCVGGAVRDALLGHPHADWDLATAATPAQVMRLFRRTVPVGVAHGTVGVLDPAGGLHEVTTFRRDVRTDGRHATVEFGASLDADLARRDFTINAIAYHPRRDILHDPFAGRRDLAAHVIRAVGDARARMREDRLRALRAIRFAARFDFAIDAPTWAAIKESVPALFQLSAERVKQELEKTMDQVREPSRALRLWRDSGALAALIPRLAGIGAVTIASLDQLPLPRGPRRDGRRMNRLAALFVGDGLDERAARAAVRELRFSNAQADWIAALAGRWTTLGREMEHVLTGSPRPSDTVVRRWVALVGRTRVPAFLRIAAARWSAARALGEPAPDAAAVASIYRRAVRSAFRDPVELADLAIDGDDLIRAGIAPGATLGRVLHALLDAVIDDPATNEPGRLLALARRLAEAP